MTRKCTIKPLEWKEEECSSFVAERIWIAETANGNYTVSYKEPDSTEWSWGYFFRDYDDECGGLPCESLEDGQQKAWENWLSRILPALEPTE